MGNVLLDVRRPGALELIESIMEEMVDLYECEKFTVMINRDRRHVHGLIIMVKLTEHVFVEEVVNRLKQYRDIMKIRRNWNLLNYNKKKKKRRGGFSLEELPFMIDPGRPTTAMFDVRKFDKNKTQKKRR